MPLKDILKKKKSTLKISNKSLAKNLVPLGHVVLARCNPVASLG